MISMTYSLGTIEWEYQTSWNGEGEKIFFANQSLTE